MYDIKATFSSELMSNQVCKFMCTQSKSCANTKIPVNKTHHSMTIVANDGIGYCWVCIRADSHYNT